MCNCSSGESIFSPAILSNVPTHNTYKSRLSSTFGQSRTNAHLDAKDSLFEEFTASSMQYFAYKAIAAENIRPEQNQSRETEHFS